MTNAQKWVSAFLMLFIILFAISKLTKTEDDTVDDVEYYGDGEQPTQAEELKDALSLIDENGCMDCHGDNLEGTDSAPSLYKLSEYWTTDELVKYLNKPFDYLSSERIQNYKEEFGSIMPSFDDVSEKEREIIAVYLLDLKE